MRADEASAGAGRSDARFMDAIAQADLAEIETGKLALAKAQSPEVKRFAQHMVDEHTAMLSEGKQLAAARSMRTPERPDLKHRAATQRLEMLSDASFDRTYMQQMVADHNNTLELLQQAAAQASDSRLRAHAQKAIAHVQQHMEMARRLTGELVGAAR